MKKISIIPAAAAVLFMSISCASVPKTQPPAESVPAAPAEQKTETEQISPEQSADAEKQGAGTEEAYGDLSEPVAPDIPEGSTPAVSQPEQEQEAASPAGEFEEPVVRDEPYAEKTAVPEKEVAAPTAPAVLPASEAKPAVRAPAAERTNTAAGADETTPVKRAADAQRVLSAGETVSQPKTAAVPKKESAASPVKSETAASSAGSETPSAEEAEKPVPSRSVTLDRNQYLDVAYPGTGWIYLGETDGTKNMTFFGRKLGETDTSFTLRARSTGRSLLHFYKNDALTGNYIDDYLEVNVTDKDASTQEHVTAPSYADAVPPRPSSAVAEPQKAGTPLKTDGTTSGTAAAAGSRIQNTETQPAGALSASAEEVPVKTVIQTTESAPDSLSRQASAAALSAGSTPQVAPDGTAAAPPSSAGSSSASGTPVVLDEQTMNESADDLLKDAQDAYGAKQYEKAQALLTVFFDKAVTRIDEGLYLQGQVLEAKSSIQNIKGAVDSYEILMKNWPDSQLWQNARQRDIYLHRMYIDIR